MRYNLYVFRKLILDYIFFYKLCTDLSKIFDYMNEVHGRFILKARKNYKRVVGHRKIQNK